MHAGGGFGQFLKLTVLRVVRPRHPQNPKGVNKRMIQRKLVTITPFCGPCWLAGPSQDQLYQLATQKSSLHVCVCVCVCVCVSVCVLEYCLVNPHTSTELIVFVSTQTCSQLGQGTLASIVSSECGTWSHAVIPSLGARARGVG